MKTPKELSDFEKVVAVPESKWTSIHDDYKGICSKEDIPYYIGRKSVLSGCITEDIGKLLIEGFHFVICPDKKVHNNYFTMQNGEVVEYVGFDDWHRPLLKRLSNDKLFVLVDGVMHSRSPEYSEPDCPLKFQFQLKKKDVHLPFDKVVKTSAYKLKYKTSIACFAKYIDDTSLLYSSDADVWYIEFAYRTHSLSCVFDTKSMHYEFEPSYDDDIQIKIRQLMETVIKKVNENCSLEHTLEELEFKF
ncbi:MAG: hypothetical protein ACPGUI_00530 [Halarcobacter sp.]